MRLMMMENDQSICDRVEMFFEREGWTVDYYGDGQEGLEAYLANKDQYDFVILSLKLTTLRGMQVLKEIRKEDENVPILILSEKISKSDQVIGLEMGADDYITKPFSEILLIAKIRAIYRRYRRTQNLGERVTQEKIIRTATLEINRATREVVFCGKNLDELTPKEFKILMTLAEHPKQVFSREHLLNLIWQDQTLGEGRTIDAHIKKLRQKMAEAGPDVIQTVWGVGYKFDDSHVVL